MVVAAADDLAKMSTPDTQLSSRCTGCRGKRSGRSAGRKDNNFVDMYVGGTMVNAMLKGLNRPALRMPSTEFLRYWPETCTGMLAGLPTASRSSVTPSTCLG